jgi:hypothetical protein
MDLVRFEGNCPRNVAKDAKYGVRTRGGSLVIGLVYNTQDGERWHATTEQHPELVRMVSEVKVALSGSHAGPFYINEYRQVIVPASGTEEYFLAGEYDRPLRFSFEGRMLSGEPIGPDGKELSPGDEWVGPRPGVPYVIKAGGADVYYKTRPRPNVERRILLSEFAGPEAAAALVRRLTVHKGWGGGRFYVNEWRAFFAPVDSREGWRFIYMGKLEDKDRWFPKPHGQVF